MARWLIAVAAALVGAFVCLALAWRYGLPLVQTSPGSGGRLALAVGAATIFGGVVIFPLASWAGRPQPDIEDPDRVLRERYDRAAGQVGNRNAPVEQRAGIAAMTNLASDWPAGRQDCIDVLCGYLRVADDTNLGHPDDHVLRLSIIDAIRSHLDGSSKVGWQGSDFDFSGAVFDGGSLDGSRFAGGSVKFSECRFTHHGLSVRRAVFFRNCALDCSRIRIDEGSSLDFGRSHFEIAHTNFSQIEMSSGLLSLAGTRWHAGFHDFQGMRLDGGRILFDGASFVPSRPLADYDHGAMLSFAGCELRAGELSFRNADFDYEHDAPSGTGRRKPKPAADYRDRPWPTTLTFYKTQFTGATVDFSTAKFTRGYVDIGHSTVARGSMLFRNSQFGPGCVSFVRSEFCDCVIDFRRAVFWHEKEFADDKPFSQQWMAPIEALARSEGNPPALQGQNQQIGGAPERMQDLLFRQLNYPLPSLDFTDAHLSKVQLEFEYIDGDGGGVIDFKGATFDGAEVCFAHTRLGAVVIVLWNAKAQKGLLRFDELARPFILTDHYHMTNDRPMIVLTNSFREGHEGVLKEMKSLRELTPWAFGINSFD